MRDGQNEARKHVKGGRSSLRPQWRPGERLERRQGRDCPTVEPVILRGKSPGGNRTRDSPSYVPFRGITQAVLGGRLALRASSCAIPGVRPDAFPSLSPSPGSVTTWHPTLAMSKQNLGLPCPLPPPSSSWQLVKPQTPLSPSLHVHSMCESPKYRL